MTSFLAEKHDEIDAELARACLTIARLQLEVADLKRQNATLRQMVPLLKSRMDSFLQWFEGTIEGIH